MTKVLLDASAITALIKEEPGADEVSAALPDAIMSAVNVTEAIRVLQRFNFTHNEATENLSFLIGEVIPFDREQSYYAARLEPIARRFGLSLGDCVCLSLAQKLNIKVLTSDTAWLLAVPEIGVDVKLIR
ncbi:MAG: type II toxin-antitoxin system VapC family toxin [Cyanobacteria bacterium P01_D01_bin.56]